MKAYRTIAALSVGAVLFSAGSALAGDVQMMINGAPAKPGEYKPTDIQSLTLSNGAVSLTFGKDAVNDFSATSVKVDGKELGHNLHGVEPRDVDRFRTFYMDYGAGRGHLRATRIKIVENTPAMAHFAVIDDGGDTPAGYPETNATSGGATIGSSAGGNANAPGRGANRAQAPAPGGRAGRGRGGGRGRSNGRYALEADFVMFRNLSGVYGYVIVNSPRAGGEMRTMYRFDRDILDYAWTAERTGQQPKYADLMKMPKMQDETWKLPDGTVYQKYDYCAYLAETPMWGHYGHGYGAFLIPASNEYYAGGPYREELLVHQDALILNYLGGGHFSGGGSATTDGPKLFGPWFLFLDHADSNEAVIADAKKMAAAQDAQWPFKWMNEPLYPLNRTTVTGQLQVQTPGPHQTASHAWVILAKPGDVYRQGGGFIYYTQADENGKYSIPHVRAGTYALHAIAREGSITDELEKDDIAIQGATQNLGTVAWNPTHHAHFLWQIGKSDRMAGEFKFGDQPRNIQWIEKVPADLTYTIGKSNPRDDWYFAQAKPGKWNIDFTVASVPAGNAYLTVALAGGGGGPRMQVEVNGQKVGNEIAPPNDASTYRAALRSGRYKVQTIQFPANLLKPGANSVTMDMISSGGRWHGLMYDTVVLESD